MPITLITGASGFLGRHLWARLLDRPPGDRPVAIGRTRPESGPAGSFRPVDLLDRDAVKLAVSELAPAIVYHLAGRTPPGRPEEFYRDNTLATLSLLDGLREWGGRCRVVLVGSAAELGPVPIESLPVAEDYSGRPAGAYGLSKWLATCAGLAAGPPLEVVVARVFNLVGPGMPVSQSLGRFADELARGIGPVRLRVGDLDARRDFLDVGDAALALIALGSSGAPGRVYHVGTGRSERIGDGLDRLIALSGREVVIEPDPSREGSTGPADSRADTRRIATETGWIPRISWEQSLRDLWEEARARAGLTDPGSAV